MNFNINLLQGVSVNFADLISFGPRFFLRHTPRITGAHTACVQIPGFGPIYLRVGQSDVAAVRQVFGNRDYDMGADNPIGGRILKRYQEIVSSGKIPIIVDAGANIGAASLWFLTEYPLACVVAIEPEPSNVAVLRKNASDKPRLLILESAVGSTPGFVSLHDHGLAWATRTIRAETGVPVVTMAEAFQRVSNGRPFIAKIDIEGFEYDLFSKNLDWLDDVYVVYIEAHDWMLPGKRTSQTFQTAMAQHDFEIFIRGENLVYVRTD